MATVKAQRTHRSGSGYIRVEPRGGKNDTHVYVGLSESEIALEMTFDEVRELISVLSDHLKDGIKPIGSKAATAAPGKRSAFA